MFVWMFSPHIHTNRDNIIIIIIIIIIVIIIIIIMLYSAGYTINGRDREAQVYDG